MTDKLKLQPGIDIKDALAQFDEKIKAGKEKLALTLVGGGAKGRWQAGFIYRLWEVGLLSRLELLTGTSVGGLNSLLTSRFINTPEKILDTWININKNEHIYKGSIPDGIFGWLNFLLTFKFLRSTELLDIAPLREIVNNIFGPRLRAMDLAIPVFTCTSDLIEGKQVIMGEQDLCMDMALTTCAIPVLFPMYNSRYADGGLMDNEPFDVAMDNGATKIIGLFCEPEEVPKKTKITNMLDIALRCFDIIYSASELKTWNAVKAKQDLNLAKGGDQVEFALFYPSSTTFNLIDFTHTELMQNGYDDACKYLTKEKVEQLLLS